MEPQGKDGVGPHERPGTGVQSFEDTYFISLLFWIFLFRWSFSDDPYKVEFGSPKVPNLLGQF